VVAVANDQGERRPQRPAMSQPRQHLDFVSLDLLTRAATVPLLAPAQILVDRHALEHKPGRQPFDDRG
jgi:hypothetical protein